MSKKGENIYKRKDGRWEGRYLKHIPGQKPRYGYVYAHSYREVRDKLRLAAAKWQTEPEPEKGKSPTFAAMAEAWERSVFPQVKESTRVKYHTTLQLHILPYIGKLTLAELNHQKVDGMAQLLMTKLSARSVSDVMSVLRSVLRFAMISGEQVPYDGRSVRIRRPPVEIRVLTHNEQARICNYVFSDLSLRNAGILLTLMTGLRIGELCALKWEDISLEEGLLHVRHTIHRLQRIEPEGPRTQLLETAPKTASSARTIPLPEDLVRVLLSLQGPREGYFLTGEDRPAEPRIMQYHFGKVTEACEVEGVTFHDLRHTFATRCVELGFDTKSLSELLGHSTVTMTLDRYVHPTMEHKRSHMQRLSPAFGASMGIHWPNRQNLSEL